MWLSAATHPAPAVTSAPSSRIVICALAGPRVIVIALRSPGWAVYVSAGSRPPALLTLSVTTPVPASAPAGMREEGEDRDEEGAAHTVHDGGGRAKLRRLDVRAPGELSGRR